MNLVTRKEAREKGATRYFTGRACAEGHIAERMTSNCGCVVCKKVLVKPFTARRNKRIWPAKYEKGKAKFIARAAAWNKAHPDVRKAINHRYRAKKRGAVGCHSAAQIGALMVSQKERCATCGCSIAGSHSIDHKTPLSRGGSNAIENIQLLCKPCNSSKGAKLMSEWRPVAHHG